MSNEESGVYLQSLSELECLERLGGCSVGRLGVVVNHYPMIFPVNYALDGDLVTFRTDPDTKFNAAHYSNVSFEVDQVDLDARTGWSVLVLGAVHVVNLNESARRKKMEELEIRPLAPGEKSIWVQIVPDRITGRRIVEESGALGFDPRGYL